MHAKSFVIAAECATQQSRKMGAASRHADSENRRLENGRRVAGRAEDGDDCGTAFFRLGRGLGHGGKGGDGCGNRVHRQG